MSSDLFTNFPEDICWIWAREEKLNQYVGALREFTLEEVCDSAHIYLFASSLYKLYINGEFVNAGPTPFRKPVMHVDTYNIAPYLKLGKNSVFIVAHYFGIDVKMLNAQKAGILASLDVAGTTIHTGDEKWKLWELDCWTADTPRIIWARGFVEEFDFAKKSARILAKYAGSDYAHSETGELPVETESRTFPVSNAEFCSRISPNLLWKFEHGARLEEIYTLNPQVQNLTDIAQRYSTDHKVPLYDAVKYYSTDRDGYTVLHRIKGGRGYGVLYDLQRIVAGDIKLEVIADNDCTIDVCMAEGKLNGVPYFNPGGAKFHYRIKCCKGRNLFRAYQFYGWRYVYVVIKDIEGAIRIKLDSCRCRADIDYLDTFECGDMELEAIYDISKRSIKLNTQACTYDCNTREVGVYWADSMWISEMVGQMSGDYRHMKQLCYMMSDEHRALGLLHSSAFGMGRTLFDFSLIAVHMLWRYYNNTADTTTLKDNIETCKSIVDDFRKSKDHTGLVTLEGMPDEINHGFLFLDHAGTTWHPMQTVAIGREDYNAGLNLFYLLALQSLLSMKEALAEKCEDIEKEIKEISALLRSRFYDSTTGLIADMCDQDGACQGHSQIINSLAIITGITTPKEVPFVMSMICDPKRYSWIAQGTPYTWLWLAEAARLSGTVDLCMCSVRNYWQDMLERGATTTWEAFGGENHDSLNHAWGAVLPQLVTRGVAGVSSLEPGFKRICVKPCLESLEQFSHTFALPQGKAQVFWEKVGARTYRLGTAFPEEVECVLSLNGQREVTYTGTYFSIITI